MQTSIVSSGLRVPFTISYFQQGSSKTWLAETDREKPVQGWTAKGGGRI